MRIDLDADTVAAASRRCNAGAPGAKEGIENRIARKAEHADEPFSKLDGVRSRMVPGWRSGQVVPHEAKPFLVILLWDYAHDARCHRRAPIPTRLALHQNILDVVLDDGIGFVRLAQEAGTVLNFISCVGNLVPKDSLKVVETELAAMLLNWGMQRHDGVAALVLPARKAYIPYHDDEPATRNKSTVTVRPDTVEFGKKILVFWNVAKLAFCLPVIFKRPVRRGTGNEMYALRAEKTHVPRVPGINLMTRRDLP
jgi:hypothetical protein